MKKFTTVALAATTSLSMICTIGMSVYAQTETESIDTVDVSNHLDESNVDNSENLDETNKENIADDAEEITTENKETTDINGLEEQPLVSEDATNSATTPNEDEVIDWGTFHFIYVDAVTGEVLNTYTFKPNVTETIQEAMENGLPEGYSFPPNLGGLGWVGHPGQDFFYTYPVQKGEWEIENAENDLIPIKIKYVDVKDGNLVGESEILWPSSYEYVTMNPYGYYMGEIPEEYVITGKVWEIQNGEIEVHVQKDDGEIEGHLFNFTFLSDKQAFDKSYLVFEKLDINSDNKIDYKEIQSLLPEGYQLDNQYKEGDIFFELVTDDTGSTSVRPVGDAVVNAFGSVFITDIKDEDPSDTDSSDDQTDASNPDGSKEDENTSSQDETSHKTTPDKEASVKKEKTTNTAYETNPIVWAGLISLALVLGIGMILCYKSKMNR